MSRSRSREIKVILVRRQGEPPKVYTHTSDKLARHRAMALAELHSATFIHEGRDYIVDARAWYKGHDFAIIEVVKGS